MSLIPRNQLFDIDRFFDEGWNAWQNFAPSVQGFKPRVDVKEKADVYEITAELPGVNKEDINVSLHGGMLTIEAETKQENTEKAEGKWVRQERRYGKFVRRFELDNQVHEGDITAQFENGLLKLTAPKVKATELTARRIEIA